MLVICCSCGRQKTVERVRKQMICGNCGASKPKIVRKVKWWMSLEDRDGMDVHEARMKVMAGLKWIAEMKHYKPAWPSLQFERMFRTKPNGEAMAVAAAPSRGVVVWVERRNAEYGREMRKRGVKWVPRNGR